MVLPKDVCDIIKTCGKAGVTHIKLQDLEIQFGFQSQLPLGSHRNVDLTKTPTQTETVAGQALSTNDHLMKMEPMDEKAMRDFTQVDALLTDPSAYEQMMMDVDLEGEGTEASRSESAV